MDVTREQVSTNESSYHSCISNLSNDITSLDGNNSISEKVMTFFDSLRLFFGSITLKTGSSSPSEMGFGCSSRRMSSGYHSFDASWEIDESYIKISKFAGESLYV